MQASQALAVLPAHVLLCTRKDAGYGRLLYADLRRDLRLRQASGAKVLNDRFPVHITRVSIIRYSVNR